MAQGAENAGKVLAVDVNGNVSPTTSSGKTLYTGPITDLIEITSSGFNILKDFDIEYSYLRGYGSYVTTVPVRKVQVSITGGSTDPHHVGFTTIVDADAILRSFWINIVYYPDASKSIKVYGRPNTKLSTDKYTPEEYIQSTAERLVYSSSSMRFYRLFV